jgi:hypothetical protein
MKGKLVKKYSKSSCEYGGEKKNGYLLHIKEVASRVAFWYI